MKEMERKKSELESCKNFFVFSFHLSSLEVSRVNEFYSFSGF